MFTIQLTTLDYIHIQQQTPMFTHTYTAYIHMESVAITDVAGNLLTTDYSVHNSSLKALSVTPDTTAPRLLAVYLDHSKHNLTLYFDKVVSYESLELGNYNLASTSGYKYGLSKATLLTTSNDYKMVSVCACCV